MSLRTPFICSVLVLVLAFLCITTATASANSFRVDNNGEHSIIGIWITPNWDGNWGDELLGEDVLDPGYFVSEYVTGCRADIRLLYDDGQVSTDWNFDTCNYNLESNY